MLEIDGLTRSFGAKAAVAGVSLQIEKGSFVGIIGRSGAGKSTLLRLINRLVEPTAGRIVFEGVDVTALHGRQLRLWRARAAMVFQQFNLIGRLDVLTNVMMGRLAAVPPWRAMMSWWPDADKAIALAALEQFEMAQLAAQRADHLSGGQQQRVAIARALVQEPDITVICNLHSLDVARAYCDRLVGMAAGAVVFDDVTAALTDNVARELYGIASDGTGKADAAMPADIGFPAGVVGQIAD